MSLIKLKGDLLQAVNIAVKQHFIFSFLQKYRTHKILVNVKTQD